LGLFCPKVSVAADTFSPFSILFVVVLAVAVATISTILQSKC
jgi:hypothetical protein